MAERPRVQTAVRGRPFPPSGLMARLVLAILAATVLFAQSQPPAPTPIEHIQEKQNDSYSKNDAAQKELAPPVRVSIPGPIHVIGEDQRAKDNQKSSTDWWIVFFTGLLAVVAVLQFLAMHRQANYMRDGLALTKQSSDAATESARIAKATLELSQRADISIEKIEKVTTDDSFDRGFITPSTVLTISAKNHGRTRGNDASTKVFVGTNAREPRLVGAEISQTIIPPETTVHILLTQANTWLEPPEFTELATFATCLVIRVEILYTDVFGTRHHTITTGEFHPHLGKTGGFIARQIDSD